MNYPTLCYIRHGNAIFEPNKGYCLIKRIKLKQEPGEHKSAAELAVEALHKTFAPVDTDLSLTNPFSPFLVTRWTLTSKNGDKILAWLEN